MAVVYTEPGHCSAADCDVNLVEEGGSVSCTIGNCDNVQVDCSTVPIKQLVNGAVVAPFVKLRFEGDDAPPGGEADWSYTEITMGNESQPYATGSQCRAAIKAFQYAWGSLGQGNVCRITIVDE